MDWDSCLEARQNILPYFKGDMAAEVAPILHLFFQASINQGILPTDWKTANVVPIFKKGDNSKADIKSSRTCCVLPSRKLAIHWLVLYV
jgi:hypothetical protein